MHRLEDQFPLRGSLAPTAALVLALACAVPSRAAAAPCPEGFAQMCNQNGTATLVAADYDSTVDDALGPYRTAYHLAIGEVLVRQPGRLCGAYVEAADAFDVLGVAPGTAVPVTAVLTTDGSVFTDGCSGTGCSGILGMRLQAGALVDETSYQLSMFSGSQPVHDQRRLDLTLVAGSPLEIRYQLWGKRGVGGAHGSEGLGRIRFEGLPGGVTVVSCQGYDSSSPSGARRTSWGSLKSIYR